MIWRERHIKVQGMTIYRFDNYSVGRAYDSLGDVGHEEPLTRDDVWARVQEYDPQATAHYER